MSEIGNVLLDTSVVILHLRSEPHLEIEQRLEDAERLYVSHVTLGELYYGAYLSANSIRYLTAIRRFLPAVEVLVDDAVTDEQYGIIKSALRRQGTPIPENDIWIAAAARRHGLPVATRDPHFEHVPDLKVLRW